MRPSRRPVTIATRNSRLALAQAQAVAAALQRCVPGVKVKLLPMVTEGDGPQTVSESAGLKGAFTRSVEQALFRQQADLAVHSLKDLPVEITPGLILAAIPPRGDARDAFIAKQCTSIQELPSAAVVGTSSPRRAAQLLRLRPDLVIKPLRGNVETRLASVLDLSQFDATLLAVAGLTRSGSAAHAKYPIDPETILPAAAQGALALQCRADDHVTMRRCLALNHPMTAEAVHAERQVVAALNADCHSPIAVLAELDNRKTMRLRARVLSADGSTCIHVDRNAPLQKVRNLVSDVVDQLKDQGAERILIQAAAPAKFNQATWVRS